MMSVHAFGSAANAPLDVTAKTAARARLCLIRKIPSLLSL
jgi:hypothetical protein